MNYTKYANYIFHNIDNSPEVRYKLLSKKRSHTIELLMI